MYYASRRDFLKAAGYSAAAMPFLSGMPCFAEQAAPKQRLIVVFSPNGTLPDQFWPKPTDDLTQGELPSILQPLEKYRSRMLSMHGVGNQIEGDGDGHMRGIGCLLTGIELFPGNIQGGSDTPAGWSSGHSIDQEIMRHLQTNPATQTRFGSLEFGIVVPDRADTWTRMVYAGPNRPLAPIDDPYTMLTKMYGDAQRQARLASVLDAVQDDLKAASSKIGADDRQMLDRHTTFVRDMEKQLQADLKQTGSDANDPDTRRNLDHAVPDLEPGVYESNDNIPKLTAMQIELLVHSLAADFTRSASLQFTNSVGGARMKWVGVDDSHHGLSHEPDSNKKAQEDLLKINRWYAEQLAMLCDRLDSIPEPGADGTMLDHTTVLWTNELGKGNSHTRNNIPWLAVGGGLGWRMGRAADFKNVPHNRLLVSLAHGFGHHIPTFGNPDYCDGGPLDLS